MTIPQETNKLYNLQYLWWLTVASSLVVIRASPMICVSASLSFYVLYVCIYIYILHVCVSVHTVYIYIHMCTYICAGYRVNPIFRGFPDHYGKHRGWNLQQPPGSLLTSPFGEYRIGWNPPASYIGLPWWCMHTHVYIYLVLWCYTLIYFMCIYNMIPYVICVYLH